jgi:hypothetical protein
LIAIDVAWLPKHFDPFFKRHLDVLSGALVVRVLEPWYAKVGKRLAGRGRARSSAVSERAADWN